MAHINAFNWTNWVCVCIVDGSKCVKATVSRCYWQSRHSNAQIDNLKVELALAPVSVRAWKFTANLAIQCSPFIWLSLSRPPFAPLFHSYFSFIGIFCPFAYHTHTCMHAKRQFYYQWSRKCANRAEQVPKYCHVETNLSWAQRMKAATVINIAMHTYPVPERFSLFLLRRRRRRCRVTFFVSFRAPLCVCSLFYLFTLVFLLSNIFEMLTKTLEKETAKHVEFKFNSWGKMREVLFVCAGIGSNVSNTEREMYVLLSAKPPSHSASTSFHFFACSNCRAVLFPEMLITVLKAFVF